MIELLPHQQRVITERDELETKIIALWAFIVSERFSSIPLEEQNDLVEQRFAMGKYMAILDRRINRFTFEEKDGTL